MNHAMMAILSCSATMTVVTLLALAVSPVLERHYSRSGLYALWLVVLVGFLFPIRIQLPQHPVMRVELPQVLSEPVRFAPVQTSELFTDPIPVRDHQIQTTLIPRIQITPAMILSAIYLFGVVLMLYIQIARHTRFMKTIRRWQQPVVDTPTLEAYKRVCADMDIKHAPALYQCAAITSPMLVGLLHPRIILPKNEPSGAALTMVLRHELTHHRRCDLYLRTLVLFARAMHWFNPATYLCERAVVHYGELSCDERAVSGTSKDQRAAYSSVILAAVRGNAQTQSLLTTSFSADKKLLKRRIIAMMDMRFKKRGVFVAVIALILSIVLGAHLVFAESGNEGKVSAEAPDESQSSLAVDADVLLQNVAALYDENGPYDTWTIGTYQQAASMLADAGILVDPNILYQYGDTQYVMQWALLDALPGVSSHFITRVAVAVWGDRDRWTQEQQFQHSQLLEEHGILTEYNTAYTVSEVDDSQTAALKQQAMAYIKQHYGVDIAARYDVDFNATTADGQTYSLTFQAQGFDDIMFRVDMDKSGEVVDLFMQNEVIDKDRAEELRPDNANLPDWTLEEQAEYAKLWMYPEYGLPEERHIQKEEALSIAGEALAREGTQFDSGIGIFVSFVIAGYDDMTYPYWRVVYQKNAAPYQTLAIVEVSAENGEILYLRVIDYSIPGLG